MCLDVDLVVELLYVVSISTIKNQYKCIWLSQYSIHQYLLYILHRHQHTSKTSSIVFYERKCRLLKQAHSLYILVEI
jgi:hypothetical protein